MFEKDSSNPNKSLKKRNLFKRRPRLQPDEVFPAEVLALRDQGIPLPTWFAGPLHNPRAYTMADALKALREARRNAADSRSADDEEASF